ncbi:MAG: polysaccharide deacetylase family protein [Firmicutes bacterium]|nr:polysaccharide deacetylase family protein [Bacillota bacterium]
MIWKNGAKAAFALGFDMDGATIWRNKAIKLPKGETFIKGPSIGAYGTEVGALRLLEILDEYDIKATWFIPAENVEKYPELVCKFLDKGHEIAHHDYDHKGEYGNTPEEQIAFIEKCQDVFLKYTGVKAKGYRDTGAILFPETEEWMYGEGGFDYISGGRPGEKCEFVTINGKETEGVNVPCRDCMMDDYMQTVMNSYPQVLIGMPRIAPYRNPYENWINELEGMIRYGNAGSPAFHPQISGTPGRAVMFEKLCRFLVEHKEIWTTTCLDIAQYFKEKERGENHA